MENELRRIAKDKATIEREKENLKKLQNHKFTVREMEILVGRSKSSVARDLKEGAMDE